LIASGKEKDRLDKGEGEEEEEGGRFKEREERN
jgi:hypothetical protein